MGHLNECHHYEVGEKNKPEEIWKMENSIIKV